MDVRDSSDDSGAGEAIGSGVRTSEPRATSETTKGSSRQELFARWRRVPRPLRWLAYVLLALFLVWLILFITKGRFLKQPATRIASRMLDRQVTVAGDFQLYFAPFSIKFLAERLTIDNPDWASKPALLSAHLLDTRIATLPLVFGRRDIRWLDMKGGALDLEWSRDGRTNTWTFGDPTQPPKPFDLPNIRIARIAGTTLRYRDPRMQISADLRIEPVQASNTSISNDIRFSGGGMARARPFTIEGALLSPNETIVGGRNRLQFTARAEDARMTVSGTLPGATQIEGADLAMTVRGRNLSRLFDLMGVAIPDTRAYRLASQLTYRDEAWRFTRMSGAFGNSDLAGQMTIMLPSARPSGRLKIDADIATRSLDMIDVGPFVGYNPERLDAQGAKAVVEQVGGRPRMLPDAPLRAEAISHFDADVRYRVTAVKQDYVPISKIDLTLGLDRSLLKLSPLTFEMAGGQLASDIVINARDVLVRTDFDIRLAPTPMGRLLGRWGVEESGTTGTIKARVELKGEGDSVRESLATSDGRIAVIIPKGTMWARNVQLSELDIGTFVQKMFEKKLKDPVEINCGLIAFTVRNGVASADPILIDTRKNVITGRGAFSFKDESLDLGVRADSKKFSLFSGQSPVGVTGYFAEPGINPISPELLGRAGAAVGLGAIASPLAAVLAFVDVGDAKAAACGPVLSGARASSQRTVKGQPRDDVGKSAPARKDR
ncbi:AsmA family protein [Sphingobium sp. CR28]|uniref:AsmA family protein n=1 Tax=Sphingobium sp. CR28 TaxID=3400272 RepID=UPI003FEEA59A